MLPRTIAALLAVFLWEVLATMTDDPRLAPHVWELVSTSYPSFALFAAGRQPDFGQATSVLVSNLVITVTRALIGLVVGTVLGLLAGLLVHFFPHQRRSSKFLLEIIRTAPLFSLLPLWVYWFAGSELGIISYIAFAVFMFVSVGCYEAVLNVSESLVFQARLLGANRPVLFRTVLLPSILPDLARTFRWIVGLLFAFSLGAEYLSSNSLGLGALAYSAYLYANVGQLIVLGMIYIGLGGILLSFTNSVSNSIYLLNQK